MADMRESETVAEQQLAEMLLKRELVWSDLPHTTRKGTMGFLELREAAFLERALTNKEARPHLVKSYEGLVSPAFNACLHQRGRLQGSALGDEERHQFERLPTRAEECPYYKERVGRCAGCLDG